MSLSLVVGVAMALGSLAYVLYPLLPTRRLGTSSALGTLRRAPHRDVTDEEIEAAVRDYRSREATGLSCRACGLRPEADALYCSSCGRRLDASSAS